MNIQIIFYSMNGHIYQMAEAVAEGARSVDGANVSLYQVPELVPDEVLKSNGAGEARKAFDHIPIAEPDVLAEADATIFGTPTRYGNMAAQMRNFLDQTGQLWLENALVGNVGGVFTGTMSQHGGQETTITSFHTTLLHLGYLIAGVPYTEQRLLETEELSGGSPYGASTLDYGDGSPHPSENEFEIAKTQGRYTAEVAKKLTS
jgi:NAD(P)H dehydrogenase (quinone)